MKKNDVWTGATVGQVAQNALTPNTPLLQGVGEAAVNGAITGGIVGGLTKAPAISYKAPSYVTSSRPVTTAAAMAGAGKSLAEGFRDQGIGIGVDALTPSSSSPDTTSGSSTPLTRSSARLAEKP